MSFEEMFMAPERLPFLTSTLGTLNVTAEQLKAMTTGSASPEEIAAMQSATADKVDKSGMKVEELMKTRIAAMKDVTGGVDEMTARLDKASQLMAASTRSMVKDTQEVSTQLLKLSNDVIDNFSIKQKQLIEKAEGVYVGLIKDVTVELEKALRQSGDIITKMQIEVDKLLTQMRAAATLGQILAPPAAPNPAAAAQPAGQAGGAQDVAFGPGATMRLSRQFGGLFEDYILDSRDAGLIGPPKMLEDILTQAKMLKEFVAAARETSVTSATEAAPTVRSTPAPASAPALPSQLQARLQPNGSTLNISIDSSAFIQYIMETMAKEYPV
jgi:hypothetical protein